MKKIVIVTGAAAVFVGASVALLGVIVDSDVAWRSGILTLGGGVAVMVAGLVLLVHEAKLAAIVAHRRVNELRTTVLPRFDHLDRNAAAMDDSVTALTDSVAALGDSVAKAAEMQRAELANLEGTMRGLHEVGLASSIEIEMSVQDAIKAVSSLYTQAESLLHVRDLLPDLRPMPSFRDWAVSPDLADYLVRLVLDTRPEAIVEIGSGSSTLVLAGAARANGLGHVVAVEHLDLYAKTTQRLIDDAGLTEWATVIHRPLQPVDVGGKMFDWYALEEGDLPLSIDLLIVDGPPGSVGEHARYPALPLLRPALGDGVRIVLDDVNRADEKSIVERWVDELPDLEVQYLGHEKGTAVLSIESDGARRSE